MRSPKLARAPALLNAPQDRSPRDPLRASATVDATKADEALRGARGAMASCGEADGVARIVTASDGSVVAIELVSGAGWEARDCVRAALEKATFAPTSGGYGVIDAGFDTAPVDDAAGAVGGLAAELFREDVEIADRSLTLLGGAWLEGALLLAASR